MIMGQDLANDKHWKFVFGYYVEACEDSNIENYMEEQTFSGIFLGPTENFQVSYKYFP